MPNNEFPADKSEQGTLLIDTDPQCDPTDSCRLRNASARLLADRLVELDFSGEVQCFGPDSSDDHAVMVRVRLSVSDAGSFFGRLRQAASLVPSLDKKSSYLTFSKVGRPLGVLELEIKTRPGLGMVLVGIDDVSGNYALMTLTPEMAITLLADLERILENLRDE